uniref:Uncharacterized protein n=1 Tax=Schlesneria paludicola TaxID=360056 RepID=A0A7C2JZV9_9PLAN
MSADVIEDRLASVERDLAAVKAELARVSAVAGAAKSSWLDLMEGSMAEFSEFDELVRLGREFRKSYHPPEDNL